MNKRVILILLVFIIGLNIVGCGNSKSPEGIDEEVWNDSLEMVEILNTIYKEERPLKRKEEIEIYEDYFKFYNNNSTLTNKEKLLTQTIIDTKLSWNSYFRIRNDSDMKTQAEERYNKAINGMKTIKEILNN